MFYTGKGDTGTTKLFSSKPGQRISKTDCTFEALGAVDELNSLLGLCRAQHTHLLVTLRKKPFEVNDILYDAQEALFVIQAELAGARKRLKKSSVTALERLIDAIEKEIPPIRNFTISGEREASAWFDYARAVARRTERSVLAYLEENPRSLSQAARSYLNRLSSLLFALGRVIAHQEKVRERAPTYGASR